MFLVPKFITRSSKDIDIWRSPCFRLYSKREFIQCWDLKGEKEFPEKLQKAIDNNLVDFVEVRNGMEAAVIAAIFVREVNDDKDSVYFTLKTRMLYLRYDTLLIDTKRGITVDEARKKTAELISRCFSEDYCSSLEKDFQGYALFKGAGVC